MRGFWRAEKPSLPGINKGGINMNLYLEYLAQEENDDRLLAALEAEARAEALEEALREGLEAARKAGDWDLYSDLHKDLYGVRPRSW
jgi:hypothetical protein